MPFVGSGTTATYGSVVSRPTPLTTPGRERSVKVMTTPAQDPASSGNQSQRTDAPTGGDETTEEELEADNAVEEDALKALDPDDTPA